VMLHFDAVISDDLEIIWASRDGSQFDTVIETVPFSMQPAADGVYVPEQRIHFMAGDRVKLKCAATVGYHITLLTEA